MSILVVDPDKTFRKGLAHVIEPYFSNIFECDNPGQAKKVLNTQYMDLILTELNFSGSDGISFIRYCTRNWTEIPLIAISSYAGEMQNRLTKLGINHMIEKPVSAQSILQTIQFIFNP